MLEQRGRGSELKLQRALADMEGARRQSSLTPHRDALSPVTWGDLERFRDDLYFRLVMMGERPVAHDVRYIHDDSMRCSRPKRKQIFPTGAGACGRTTVRMRSYRTDRRLC
jgi:hypothetical protein